MSAGRPVARLRVATVNVRELLDDGRALRRVLGVVAADVVCVQEAPVHPLAVHRLGDLAAAAGLWVTAAGRAGAGTAVLTAARVDVRAADVLPLPTPRWRHRRPVRARGAAEVVVRVPLGASWSLPVRVTSVHLGLDAAEREEQADVLLARGGDEPQVPAVLAGDLNEGPDGPVRVRLATVLADAAQVAGATAATFPARAPRSRLDVVLADRRLGVAGAGTADVPAAVAAAATDHLAVVADLLVPGA
ncbi:endonuclease/exonuclease/phosphatase family protein [Kineococcus sp. SYSU DK004]|uniref:endonuclease/exonuclease/phosphatase family protein n=1 Tax=Kineococcus sp. SYSU DK004 TaxID=3383125 RepID=UPI003D7E6424